MRESLALRFERACPARLVSISNILAKSIFSVSFGLFLFGFFTEAFSLGQLRFLLGILLLAFAFTIKTFLIGLFKESLRDQIPQISFQAAFALESALREAKKKKLGEVSSHLLLQALIAQNTAMQVALLRVLIDSRALQTRLQQAITLLPRIPAALPAFDQDIQKALEEAAAEAGRRSAKITSAMLLAALGKTSPIFKETLLRMNMEVEDLLHLGLWQERLEEKWKNEKRFWLPDNLRKRGSLGRDMASAYTITLDRFVIDRTEEARLLGFPRIVGHEKEMKAMERALTRQERHHVLLVGDPGSGKKNMMWELASMMALGQTTPEIAYYRLLELNLQELVAQAQSKEETEALLNRIFQEAAAAGNVVLFLDDIQNFAATSEEQENLPGYVPIKGSLAPFLGMPDFRLIASSTYAGLHLRLEQDPSFLSFFELIEVQEISQAQTLEVLETKIGFLEYKSKCLIPYPTLKEIIRLTEKYIQGTPFPKKAVDLLEESMAYLLQTKERVLLPGHVAAVLTERVQIPIGKIETTERETLLNLEDLLHKRIINQEEAVKEVSASLRRARTEVASRKGPMGSFLFLGPTGVGKTETAKALAAVYFGSESRIVRLDMSEFQNPTDIDRLLGSKGQEGLLTTPIRENPFSLLLLDELEKASPNILNLFLQVLDEGSVTDGLGRKISFMHTIIIATSNAGYQFILEAIKQNKDFKQLKEEMLDYLFKEGIYRPEFLNRFDSVVIFTPLTKQHLKDVAKLMLGRVRQNLEKKGVDLVITEQLTEKMAELGYDPKFGARNMRRVIQDKIENALAEAVLRDHLQPGIKIEIDPETFTLRKVF